MQTVHRNVSWLRERELGMPVSVGHQDRLSQMLYSSVNVVDFWDPAVSCHENHRGIFNFDFSTDGKVLVAACEGRSFLVFDPNNHRLLCARRKAHTDCVNCVRFLDTRSFVTCSDDTTVVLWDLRFLKNGVRVFAGHTSWVKNIEYASSLGLLITSGFDGSVYSWNINNYSKEEDCRRLFHMEGLMRCKLTPDESKLVLSTSRGYLLVIHDLHLPSLNVNMDGYKAEGHSGPRLCSTIANFYSLFRRPRNRLEVINEFPARNDAENIASLQVHPQGWCIVSRNTSKNDATEWTCVHDIHTKPSLRNTEEKEEEDEEAEGEDEGPSQPQRSVSRSAATSARTRPSLLVRWHVRQQRHGGSSSSSTNAGPAGPSQSHPPNGTGPTPASLPHSSPRMLSAAETLSSSENEDDVDREEDDTDSSDSELWDMDGASGSREGQAEQRTDMDLYRFFLRAQWNDMRLSLHMDEILNHLGGSHRGGERADSHSQDTPLSGSDPQPAPNTQHREGLRLVRGMTGRSQRLMNVTHHNFPQGLQQYLRAYFMHYGVGGGGSSYHSKPRLIYCQQEPNVGRGFIKEQCFSSDGRLIISPCGNGIRLLAFDDRCQELCDCEPAVAGKWRPMHAVRELRMHPHVVLTTRFSPTQSLFVSGSLDGSIAFVTPSP